jgi:hypothetical protein
LCRSHAIPAGISRYSAMSLGIGQRFGQPMNLVSMQAISVTHASWVSLGLLSILEFGTRGSDVPQKAPHGPTVAINCTVLTNHRGVSRSISMVFSQTRPRIPRRPRTCALDEVTQYARKSIPTARATRSKPRMRLRRNVNAPGGGLLLRRSTTGTSFPQHKMFWSLRFRRN